MIIIIKRTGGSRQTDFKKTYDIVPQNWILNCLRMYKIPDHVVQFIEKTMPTYRVKITAGGKSLAKI